MTHTSHDAAAVFRTDSKSDFSCSSPDAVFAWAHAFTAAHEGGLTQHPADPGGITNCGVSLRWLRELAGERQAAGRSSDNLDFDRDGDIDADDIRALTRQDAERLFRNTFWKDSGACTLPAPIAAALYDTAVNCGTHRAVTMLQRVLGLKQDGIIGPRTRAAAHIGDSYAAALRLLDERAAFYRRLAEQRPELRVFLKGWLRRVRDLAACIEAHRGGDA